MKEHAPAPNTPPSRHLSVIYKGATSLRPDLRNARTHSKRQIQQIASSILEFGFTNPILIDPEGVLIAGHGRLLAAKSLGMGEVPTIELSGLSDAQKRALRLADNKIALNAGWDVDLLRVELGELSALDVDFDLTLTGKLIFTMVAVRWAALEERTVDRTNHDSYRGRHPGHHCGSKCHNRCGAGCICGSSNKLKAPAEKQDQKAQKPVSGPDDHGASPTEMRHGQYSVLRKRTTPRLTPEEAIECQSADQAIRRARSMVGKHPGAVAFKRTGDPDLGEFQPAVVLGRFERRRPASFIQEVIAGASVARGGLVPLSRHTLPGGFGGPAIRQSR